MFICVSMLGLVLIKRSFCIQEPRASANEPITAPARYWNLTSFLRLNYHRKNYFIRKISQLCVRFLNNQGSDNCQEDLSYNYEQATWKNESCSRSFVGGPFILSQVPVTTLSPRSPGRAFLFLNQPCTNWQSRLGGARQLRKSELFRRGILGNPVRWDKFYSHKRHKHFGSPA